MFGHDDKQDENNQTNDSPAPDAALDDLVAPDDANDAPLDSSHSGAPAVDDSTASSGTDDDLLGIKRQALQQLQPLVGHLEQSPEEKFKTTMMMIQAADDKSLIQTAYSAAQQITDEKARAQALLDVINEINYFTHAQDQDKEG